jgi:hypothetical protein
MKSITFTILITICICNNVDILNEEAFPEFEKHSNFYIIGFFENKEDSADIYSLYEKAAEGSYKDNLGVNFVRVNIDESPSFKENWKLETLPSFFWVDAKKSVKEDVPKLNFLNYIRTKLGLSEVHYNDAGLDEIGKLTANHVIAILDDLYDVQHQDKISAFDRIRLKSGYNGVIVTTAAELKERFPNNMFVYWDGAAKSFTEIEVADDLFADDEKLNDKMVHYRLPAYKTLGEGELIMLMEEGKPTLLLVYNNKTDETTVNEFMTSLGRKYKGELFMFNSTLSNPMIGIISEVLAIKDSKLPFILLTKAKPDSDDDLDKYGFDKFDLTKENVERLIDQFKEGVLPPYVISEDIPEGNPDNHGVYKVVSKNLKDFLNTKNKDIVLIVCTKLQNKCAKLKERVHRLVQKFREANIIFGETDPNFNEYDVTILQKYPNIFFFPAENSDITHIEKFNNGIIYEGDFTTKHLTDWIAQNSRQDVTVRGLDNEDGINKAEEEDKIVSVQSGEDRDFNFDEFFESAMFKNMNFGDGEDVDMDGFKDFFKNMANGEGAGGLGGLGELENIADTLQDASEMDIEALKDLVGKKDDL